jgi:diguanylate cyclase (GGDEF)-like protein
MIDIDHFKQINDTYGHEVGDMALKACADVCSSKLREVDLFARFGGEEFVVLLPNTPLSGAIIMAERIRKAVGRIKLMIEGNKIQFNISIGVTSALETDTNIDDVIRRSDNALYEAKKDGRNRVVSSFS